MGQVTTGDIQGLAAAPEALREALPAAGRIVRARAGQVIVSAGAASQDVYLINSGRLQVTLFAARDREIILRDFGPGQMFGELAAIDGRPRSASVTAAEASVLTVIAAPAFRALVCNTPEAALWFARQLTRHVRDMNEKVFELSALNVRSRLHCQLLRMAAAAGVVANQAVVRPVPTHEQFAALIGTHREAVTREFGALSAMGLVNRSRSNLTIVDVDRLAAIVRALTPAGIGAGMMG